MIIGLCIRNFKVYKNINYIPLSNGQNFSALIGMNGVGKSSVLESLDCFFNQKEWIHNIDNNIATDSWIMPVFVLRKDLYDFEDLTPLVEKITDYVLNGEIPNDAVSSNFKPYIESIRDQLQKGMEAEYNVLPICVHCNYQAIAGLFNFQHFVSSVFGDDAKEDNYNEQLTQLYEKVRNQISYVYVPKDIEADRLAKFENKEIQRLIGKDLESIVANSLSQAKILGISRDLKGFVNNVSDTLGEYIFKVNSGNQPNLKPYKIYNLIIDEFFSLRQLFKKVEGGKDIPLGRLSSGEKQQAIITLVTRIASQYRDSSRKLIVAMDEPESSLHVSLCYPQFERLYDLSHCCCQVLLSSHWYGFIPTLPDGCITYISHDQAHEFNLFDAYRYKEELRIADNDARGKLPVDVMLKSNNDLIQSIISSIVKENCYNWIICEGSSDKVYLSAYLDNEIKNNHLRIVPVCKASEVKKMYDQLSLAADDLKKSIKGKVFLLTDTDTQFMKITTHDSVDGLIRCRRIVNNGERTELVRCESNPVSPNTDIEDALNGKLYHEVLMTFKNSNPELNIISSEPCEEVCSYFAINLGPKDREKLDEFFSKDNGRNKVEFANRYIEGMMTGKYIEPEWISKIREFFNT